MALETPATPKNDSEIRRILEERAAALARIPEEKRRGEALELVMARLGHEQYGIPIQHVERIEPLRRLTAIPGIPDFWAGVANLHGRLYPVLDLAAFLGVASEREPGPGQDDGQVGDVLIVVGSGLHVGLFVDEVLEVQAVLRDEVTEPLGGGGRESHESITGLTPDLSGIIDVDKLFADPRLVVEQRMQ